MTNKRNVFLSVLLVLLMISLPAMASSLDGLTVVSEEPSIRHRLYPDALSGWIY